MAVSVQEIRRLSGQIADKAEESERLFAEANERYGEYERSQQELRELAAQFNVLTQKMTAPPAAAKTAG